MPTLEQIALVQTLLPTAAITDYGWTTEFVSNLMVDKGFSSTEAIRYFWLQRVNETSEYLDVNGKPLTQIHAQAKAMLEYWDNVLKLSGPEGTGPSDKRPLTFGTIEGPPRRGRRYEYDES